MKAKKKLLAVGACATALSVAAVCGTMAHLTDTNSDVNVMALGDVKINQLEFERAVDANGEFEMVTTDRGTGYKLVEFDQMKPLYPAVGKVTGWDNTLVYFEQFGEGHELGAMNVLDGLENVQDKFVFVENTGKSDAYVRTLIAFESGSLSEDEWNDLINTSVNGFWDSEGVGIVDINGNNYYAMEYVYSGADGENARHPDGIVHPGDYTYNNLAQVYMAPEADSDDVEAIDGNKNGAYDILVLSQAVQAEGFTNAEAALTAGFGDATVENTEAWFTDGEVTIPEIASNQDELNQLLASGAEKIVLADGEEYALPASVEGVEIIGGKIVMDAPADGEKTDVITAGDGTTFTGVEFVINDETGSGAGDAAFVKVAGEGVVFDGCSFDISGTNMTAVEIGGGADGTVVKNCEFVGGYKHIGPGSGIPNNTVIEDCTFAGANSSYAMHLNVTTGDLVVKNSEIALFNTFFGHGGDTGKLVFENCDFIVEPGKTNVVKLYRDAEFINCDFEEGFLFSDANKAISVDFVGGSWGDGSIKDHFLSDSFTYNITASFDGEVWLWDAAAETWTQQ